MLLTVLKKPNIINQNKNDDIKFPEENNKEMLF